MSLQTFISDFQKKLEVLNSRNTSSKIELIKSNLKRLEQIERQLEIQSYKFVFIGEPGSGKTTTICNYLNLTKIVKPGDRFSGFELFDTASGRTTAFEVHYQKAEQTRFVIYPMDTAKQKALIREYCEYNWRKVFKPTDNESDENNAKGRDGCSESDRIIRNMLGFLNDTNFQSFINEDYHENEYDQFLENMMDKVNVESRTCTEIIYHEQDDARKWLKKIFNDINFGKRTDTAIPEQVDVFLNPNDLDFIMPEFITEVIDTRGYDGGAREDLRAYIREEDTISVILDKVESLPGERQRKILSEWIDSEEFDIINRISLIIKEKDDALSKVNEADGDRDKGEEIKLDELSHAISDYGLHYNEHNTLFVDSYEGIQLKQEYKIVEGRKKKDGHSIIDIDDEMRDYERQKITNHFIKIIQQHKDFLAKEAERIQQDTEQLYHAITTASAIEILQDKLKETEHLVTAVKDTLSNEIDESFLDCEMPFCDQFKRHCHWASARKTATIAWHGTWYKAEIYAEYMDFCESIVKKVSTSKKEQIIGYIDDLKKCNATSAEIRSFVNSSIMKIDLEYRSMIENIRSIAKNQANQAFDSVFWEHTENVEKGRGYYERLKEAIRKQMRRTYLCQHTLDEIQKKIDYFFSEIIYTLQSESNLL